MVKSIDILSTSYVGSDIIYMAIISILSLLTITLCELFKTKFSFTDPVNSPPDYDILDTDVKEEIAMINEDRTDKTDFAVQVKNLEKNYSIPCFGPEMKNSVDKLSFHLNKGECFALLGLNGAGKTSTFKCLTCEIFPTKGEIYINGMELTQNFENVRNMIGYCPQFDAIFDYMTVYENLYFYASVKGIPFEKVKINLNLA
jgi:ABC-type multidrug transport system fused ATPase/permease subunit